MLTVGIPWSAPDSVDMAATLLECGGLLPFSVFLFEIRKNRKVLRIKIVS